jgi:hypothetical protein
VRYGRPKLFDSELHGPGSSSTDQHISAGCEKRPGYLEPDPLGTTSYQSLLAAEKLLHEFPFTFLQKWLSTTTNLTPW